MSSKDMMIVGAISGAVAVILGAFGAHFLAEIMTDKEMANFKTAGQYHFIHSFLMIFSGYYYRRHPKRAIIKYAGVTLLAGILLFCFSLYLYAIIDGKWLTILTPVGGISFTISWILLALGFMQKD